MSVCNNGKEARHTVRHTKNPRQPKLTRIVMNVSNQTDYTNIAAVVVESKRPRQPKLTGSPETKAN